MKYPENFTFMVEDDKLKVKFLSQKKLGRLDDGTHAKGGDYGDLTIRLLRYENCGTNQASFLHELGHYLCERQELRDGLKDKTATEEDACDLLTWLPGIIHDRRNEDLRNFLGVKRTKEELARG